jgi:WD40 repeat protein
MTSDECSIRRQNEAHFSLFPEEVRRSAFPIGERHVLTAAHCVRDISPVWFRIRVGDRPPVFRYIPLVLLKIDATHDIAVLGVDHPRLGGARITAEEARAVLGHAAIPLRATFDQKWPVFIAGFPEGRSAGDSTTLSAESRPILSWLGNASLMQVQVGAFAAANPDFAYGMSGGPVLADAPDGLCAIGVLKGVPSGSDGSGPKGGMVFATPISAVLGIDEIADAIKPPGRTRRAVLLTTAGGILLAGAAVIAGTELLGSSDTPRTGSEPSDSPTLHGSSAASAAPLRTGPSPRVTTATPAAVIGVDQPLDTLAFQPGTALMASAGGGNHRISVWNTAGDLSRPSATATEPVTAVAFQPGATRIVSAQDSGLHMWDASVPGRLTAVGTQFGGGRGSAFSVAFTSDGNTLAAGYWNNSVALWDTSDPGAVGALGSSTVHGNSVTSVAFNPGNDILASASLDTTIRLWKVSAQGDLQPITTLTPETIGLTSVAFSPDGSALVSGGQDGNIRFWDVATPATARQITTGAVDLGTAVLTVSYSRDWLVVAGCADGSVHLFDASDPAAPRRIGRHALVGLAPGSFVHATAFDTKGTLIGAATSYGSGDSHGQIGLWRLS